MKLALCANLISNQLHIHHHHRPQRGATLQGGRARQNREVQKSSKTTAKQKLTFL